MGEYCNLIDSNCVHEVTVENRCFLIMSYKRSKRLEETFYGVIENEYKLVPVIAKKVKVTRGSPLMFCKKICQEIKKSLVCFADVSRPNINVGFEVGIAWRYYKPTFLTMNKRMRKQPPSDLGALFGIWYSNYNDLRKKLTEVIDVNWIRKIKRQRGKLKKKQLLLEMLRKYSVEPPPAI